MKTFKIYLPLALLLSLMLGSCKKFVDKASTDYQTLITKASDAQQVLDNYAVMNTNYPGDGEVSADDYIVSDAGFLQSSLSQADRDLYTWSAGAIRAEAAPQWQSAYSVVYNANLVLESIDNLKGSESQQVLNNLRGQALFFRAYAFWQLAQVYAKPYNMTTANIDMGIPLFLSANITGKYDRGTVQQTYSRIIQDLTDASGLLTNPVVVASRPSQAAAVAMLARVYLSMEDYPNALIQSGNAMVQKPASNLLTYSSQNVTSNTPFARFNTEVIFHSTMALEPILNPGVTGSNTARVDAALAASYITNDMRAKLFLKLNPDNSTYRFTGSYEPTVAAAFFNGLAIDEMLLIRAECYARAGNVPLATADMNTLLAKRWSGTYPGFTATDPADALNKILAERRKELLMRGLRWSDLRRLNKTPATAKTLTRVVNTTTYTLPANDLRYTLLIPNEVIVKSKGMVQQNLR